MSTLTHYHKSIRKITAGFASLFNNIMLIRENTDGSENQRIIVPLEFADKEKYIKRLQGDQELDKKVQITLPRMSYELNGFRYDAARKLNTNNKTFGSIEDKTFFQYNPVPYDFDFSLTIYTRTIEDGNQILEQIIPYFAPDYTIKINMVPELSIIRNIPIVLNQTQSLIDSGGLFNTEARTVFWTLSFTAKAFIFGGMRDVSSSIIKNQTLHFTSNMTTNIIEAPELVFSYQMVSGGYGGYKYNEVVYQGINLDNSYFSARVYSWDSVNNILVLYLEKGDIKINQPLIGKETLSNFIVESQTQGSANAVTIIQTLNPTNATANSNWTVNTAIIGY